MFAGALMKVRDITNGVCINFNGAAVERARERCDAQKSQISKKETAEAFMISVLREKMKHVTVT
jgi:hypothetical protein